MLLTGEGVQLLPQSSNVGFKEGVEASAPRPCGTLLLEEFPLGLQDLILLLKEPNLNDHRGGQKRSQIITKSISLLIFFPTFSVTFSHLMSSTLLPVLSSEREPQGLTGWRGPQL